MIKNLNSQDLFLDAKGKVKTGINWRGNRKLRWPTWSLPAVKSCPDATAACRATCYALKAERCYPSARDSRAQNMVRSLSADFVDTLTAEILKKKPEIFRIHESGDFYNEKYFQKWLDIARNCPDVQFFSYTKVFSIFDSEAYKNRPKNFVLLASEYYDETRPMPKSVPIFKTLAKGEAYNPANGASPCNGACNECRICPFATSETRVDAELH